MRYKVRTKEEHQQWWADLTPDERELQIQKWQAQKAERRECLPEKKLKYNPKYSWLTKGVNPKNRSKWVKTILKKNPWLDPKLLKAS